MSLLNDERDNYIFGGLAAKAGKFLPGGLRGFAKHLSKLSQVGDYAAPYQTNRRYSSPLNNTTELLRRKKPKYESDGYFLLAESNRRQKENIETPVEVNKYFKELEKDYLKKFPKDFHTDVKEALKKAKQLDLDAIKEDKLAFKEDQKRIRKLINDLKGKEKNRTEMKDGGVSMLKPDYIDIDGDGNKTEPMKTAAKQRDQKAEGGDIDGQMSMLMMAKKPEEDMMPEEDMLPDNEMEDEYLDFILDEALDNEEEDFLMDALQGNEQLSMIFDKVIDVAQEFAGSGPVEGPGSGVSDSIPARLSDGEFVFTAKAVDQIGADNLMAMMKDAEMKADDRQGLAEGGEPEEEETVVMPVEKPASQQDIRVTKTTVGAQASKQEQDDLIGDEVKKSMLRGSRNLG